MVRGKKIRGHRCPPTHHTDSGYLCQRILGWILPTFLHFQFFTHRSPQTSSALWEDPPLSSTESDGFRGGGCRKWNLKKPWEYSRVSNKHIFLLFSRIFVNLCFVFFSVFEPWVLEKISVKKGPPPEILEKWAQNAKIEFLEFPSLPKGKDGNSKNQKISVFERRAPHTSCVNLN